MGPCLNPQHTRADFGPEAVGSSVHKHYTSPINIPYGRVKSRMVAELCLKPQHAAVRRQFDNVDPGQEDSQDR